MKIIHSTLVKKLPSNSGVLNQMLSELNTSKSKELNYEVKVFTNDKPVNSEYDALVHYANINSNFKAVEWLKFRISYYIWLKSLEKTIDCYVLRYTPADPFQYIFIKYITKPICLVHHTKELEELKIGGLKNRIKWISESLFGKLSIQSSTIICAVTNELIEYEKQRAKTPDKPSILKPNGIKFQNTAFTDLRSNEIPEFIFIASYFYDWHGLDLLIDEANKSDKDFIVHLVGRLNARDYSEARKSSKFKVHGSLNKNEINKLSLQCWAGIGSLALFRKDTIEGCTLKVREYLNMGLPVYSGHQDIFPWNFEYFKYDNKININNMLEFAKSFRSTSKEVIQINAEKYISQDYLTQDFYFTLTNKISETKIK